MRNTNMRSGFTMIELVFVIVIIGILAAVAIPKLAANRDDAAAKVCENDAAALFQEITGYYGKNGYWDVVENVSNLPLSTPATTGSNGIVEATGAVLAVGDGSTLTYRCNGEDIAVFTAISTQVTDTQGIQHTRTGVVVTDPGTEATTTGQIAQTDFQNKNFYKASPGYVIGGN